MIGEHGEELFYFPQIRAENWTPHGRKVLVRAERPPARASVVWTPMHADKEKEGRALGFVVYGTVVRSGPGSWEPAWSWDGHRFLAAHLHRDAKKVLRKFKGANGPEARLMLEEPGKLVFVPCSLEPGDKVVWAHGWGPRVELAEGTHFSIHEAGIQATWTVDHVHCWHDDNCDNGETECRALHYFCCADDCDERRRSLETETPACGAKGRGSPRVVEHVESYNPTRIEPPPGDPPPDPDDERPVGMRFEGEDDA
jgi:hypothetical protein